jgi:hypothetical protein
MHTITLMIDYDNGVQKNYSSIPWNEDLTILEAILAGAKLTPETTITFGSDRSGHVLGLAVDGVPPNNSPALEWVTWVNGKSFEHRLGTDTSFGFIPDERSANLLQPGDHVLIRLSVKPETPGMV